MLNTNSNLSNTYKLLPIESVLNDVYRVFESTNPDIMGESDLLESASRAAHYLYNHKYYEEAICMTSFDNFRTTVPDYRKIKMVFWKDTMDKSEYDDMISVTETDLTTDPNTVTAKATYDLKRSVSKYSWNLAYPKHNVSTMVHINTNGEHDIGSSCQITYSVKECVMTVSKKDGYLLIVYDRLLRNEEGSLLIPFLPEVSNAIEAHVMMEIQKRQLNAHRDGSMSLYRMYKDEWHFYSEKARAKLLMLDLPEWVSMINETDKLVQGNDPLVRHVNEHNGPEYMNLGNSTTSYF